MGMKSVCVVTGTVMSFEYWVVAAEIKEGMVFHTVSLLCFCAESVNFFLLSIARGKYAVVKNCSDNKTRKQLVAKLIKYEADTEKNTKQEFEIMATLKHDKLLTARDGFIVQKYVVIVMDRWVPFINHIIIITPLSKSNLWHKSRGPL